MIVDLKKLSKENIVQSKICIIGGGTVFIFVLLLFFQALEAQILVLCCLLWPPGLHIVSKKNKKF